MTVAWLKRPKLYGNSRFEGRGENLGILVQSLGLDRLKAEGGWMPKGRAGNQRKEGKGIFDNI